MFKKKFNTTNNIVEIVTISILILKLAFILFSSPSIGMADNGDYFRSISQFGLTNINNPPHFFSEFNQTYLIDTERINKDKYVTTQTYLIQKALASSKFLGNSKFFDIRTLGLIYSFLFVLSCLLILKTITNIYGKIACSLFFLFILSDTGYIAYINSFYGEALSFVSLLLIIAFLLRMIFNDKNGFYATLTMIFLCVSIAFFVGAKQQNSPMILFFTIAILRFIYLKKINITNVFILFVGLSIAGFTCWNVYSNISDEIRNINNFHTITLGILKESPTPEKDLAYFGIDTKYVALKNTTIYEGSSIFDIKSQGVKEEFFDKINTKKIVSFYLHNPDRIFLMLEKSVINGFEISPFSMIHSSNNNKFYETVKKDIFGAWSKIKLKFMYGSIISVFVFYVIFFAGTIMLHIKSANVKSKLIVELLWLITVIGFAQIPIAFIGAGEADLAKHLFIFNVCFDVSVGFLGISLIIAFANNYKKLKYLQAYNLFNNQQYKLPKNYDYQAFVRKTR